jgi:glycosyltransferase involved in cell wall biosynthesis
MRISVVTVCYNSVSTIEQTLVSVARQTHPDVEHIVIDGGSTDGTLDVLERHRAGLAVVVSEPDRGLYDAMNKGWSRATGEVVGFLNADDSYASTDVLAAIATAFEESGTDAVYGDLELVDRAGNVVRVWRSGPFRRLKYHLGWMTPHPATYVRKTLFERYGGFTLGLSISADYELMLRFFFRHRASVQYLEKNLVRMTAGGASNRSLSNIARANWQVFRSWGMNGLFTTPTIMLTKPLSKLAQLRW